MNGKLGDIQWPSGDPSEEFYRAIRQAGPMLSRFADIVSARGQNAVPMTPEEEAQWRMWMDVLTKAQCSTFFTMSEWKEPTPSSYGVTLENPTAHAITPTDGVVLTAKVPDRTIYVLTRVGGAVGDPLALPPPTTRWSITRNGRKEFGWSDLVTLYGNITDPQPLADPLTFRPGEEIGVLVRGTVATEFFIRLVVWGNGVRSVTQDGSYQEFHTI